MAAGLPLRRTLKRNCPLISPVDVNRDPVISRKKLANYGRREARRSDSMPAASVSAKRASPPFAFVSRVFGLVDGLGRFAPKIPMTGLSRSDNARKPERRSICPYLGAGCHYVVEGVVKQFVLAGPTRSDCSMCRKILVQSFA